jgi:hypothetical protein
MVRRASKRTLREEQQKREQQKREEESRAHIYPLSVTSVSEEEDGSLEVSSGGQTAHLEGDDANAVKLATSGAYRAATESEQQPEAKRALELLRQAGLV